MRHTGSSRFIPSLPTPHLPAANKSNSPQLVSITQQPALNRSPESAQSLTHPHPPTPSQQGFVCSVSRGELPHSNSHSLLQPTPESPRVRSQAKPLSPKSKSRLGEASGQLLCAATSRCDVLLNLSSSTGLAAEPKLSNSVPCSAVLRSPRSSQ